ncbi:hypothetical protein FNV43_RR15244 [Rhamnella rubrinervis]|uniref:RNA polymerase Rpb7-like N-terminal domain-containing protein n=1 Tax=Rhamnella rubrinervis TaxID=2594499 RepID=A0A8K0E8M7_9ROSA|nr:hypothetical protein FNV43_RR15244 [Rhamnella rubrinervis]
MFYLTRIEHKLRVPPDLHDRPIEEAIKVELQKLFVDKVIANLGLCNFVCDIRSITCGFIFPSEGSTAYTEELQNLSSTTGEKGDDLIRVLRELTTVQRKIADLQVELQGRKDDKTVAHLTHVPKWKRSARHWQGLLPY